MSGMTIEALSERMREIDFAMLMTRTQGGHLAGRPMSNNGDVAYRGDSHFFTYEQTRTVADIQREPEVALSFAGKPSLPGRPGIFIAVQGQAELIRDRAAFERHWVKDLERWFEQGVDTPGLVLIRVRAHRVHYWDGEEGGEVPLG